MSEEMVGVCGHCSSMQGYHPSNMMLMSSRPDIDWSEEPDVYEGDIWYCQGCGSGTKWVVTMTKAKEMIE